MSLKRQSPIPLYYQLAETLLEMIRLGEFKAGAQLPAERELSEQYRISRMTVRQALAYLIQEGYLIARHGLGTFVAEPKMAHDPLHLLGFTEEMMRLGVSPSSRVIEQVIVKPPTRVAADLALAAEASTVKIVRLRLLDGVPLLLETVFIPATLCPGLEKEDLSAQSLYALLGKHYGLHLSHARQTLEAVTASAYEAELFGIPRDAPMVLLEGVTYLETQQPIEYFKAVYRGDRFKFELESQRNTWTLDMSGAPRLSVVMR
jgi:GntR family transcriptional regulator